MFQQFVLHASELWKSVVVWRNIFDLTDAEVAFLAEVVMGYGGSPFSNFA